MLVHLWMLILFTTATAGIPVCPEQRRTGDVRFTKELAGEDMVRFQMAIAVQCCAEGYDNITWLRKSGSQWKSYPPVIEGRSDVPFLDEDNQVLRINQAQMSDSTVFRCNLIKDEAVVKNHDTEIIVQRCNPLARGPLAIDPGPQNATIESFGGNITFYCTGYFGCGRSFDYGFVYWTKDKKWIKNENGSRYILESYSKSSDRTTLGQKLTILNVEKQDIGQTFTCNLESAQIKDSSTKIPVQISFRKLPPNDRKYIIGVGIAVGVIVLLVILFCTVKCCYGPQIWLFIRSSLPVLSQVKKRDGNLKYNGLLYHAADDTSTAHSIREDLQKTGLDIYISHDMYGNKSLGEYEEKVDQSLMVLFLYTQNLREDDFAHFLLQSLISSRNFKKVIFLVKEEYSPKKAMKENTAAVNKESNRNDPDENHQGMDNNAEDIEMDGDKATKKEDLSFWKSLPRCKMPTEKASERQKKNFLCWLQNKIPKFEDQVRKRKNIRRGSQNASGRRLLDSHEDEPTTPVSQNLGEDDVFVSLGNTELKTVTVPGNEDDIEQQPENGICCHPDTQRHNLGSNFDEITNINEGAVDTVRDGGSVEPYSTATSNSKEIPSQFIDINLANAHGKLSPDDTLLLSNSSGIGSAVSGYFDYGMSRGGNNVSSSINIPTVKVNETDPKNAPRRNVGSSISNGSNSWSERQTSEESGYSTSVGISSPECRENSFNMVVN